MAHVGSNLASDDHRIAEAHRRDWDGLVDQLAIRGLKRFGVERVGPCPSCGGTDRFAINTRKGVFQCRRCGAKGDQIALVQLVLGLAFPDALDWIAGPRQELTPEQRADRERIDHENALRKATDEARFLQNAIAEARAIWRAARPAEGTLVREYLRLRGLSQARLPRLPRALRFHPDLPYMVQSSNGRWIEAHRGPAMIAAVQGPDDVARATHRTWFDVSQPLGKIVITHPETGAEQKRKKTWGSKKGGAIRLTDHQDSVLVMGEGIETTLSAFVAGKFPGAMFWAGVDLGNMSGQRQLGKGLKYAGVPDLTDEEAFVPPPFVTRLIYVMDGDSDPRTTKAQLQAGLRRAMLLRPGLRGQIAHTPEGFDLNDVLLGLPRESDDE